MTDAPTLWIGTKGTECKGSKQKSPDSEAGSPTPDPPSSPACGRGSRRGERGRGGRRALIRQRASAGQRGGQAAVGNESPRPAATPPITSPSLPQRGTHLARRARGPLTGSHLLFAEAPGRTGLSSPRWLQRQTSYCLPQGRNTSRQLQVSAEVTGGLEKPRDTEGRRGRGGRRIFAGEAARRPQQLRVEPHRTRPQPPAPRRAARARRKPPRPPRPRPAVLRAHRSRGGGSAGVRPSAPQPGRPQRPAPQRPAATARARTRAAADPDKAGRPRTARRLPGTCADAQSSGPRRTHAPPHAPSRPPVPRRPGPSPGAPPPRRAAPRGAGPRSRRSPWSPRPRTLARRGGGRGAGLSAIFPARAAHRPRSLSPAGCARAAPPQLFIQPARRASAARGSPAAARSASSAAAATGPVRRGRASSRHQRNPPPPAPPPRRPALAARGRRR